MTTDTATPTPAEAARPGAQGLADKLEQFHANTPIWAKADRDILWQAVVALRNTVPAEAAPVAVWQVRWLNPDNMPHQSENALAWKEVELKTHHDGSVEKALHELRAYRFRGLPCYEVRPLYAAPQAAAVAPDVQRDAERYRWLRNESYLAGPFDEAGRMVWAVVGASGGDFAPCCGTDLDTAIDAARAATGTTSKGEAS